MLSEIEVVAKDEKLLAEKNFISRTDAIDDIEFYTTDRLHALNTGADSYEPINELILCAEKMKHRLEAINIKMFERLRTEISQGKCRGERLIQLVDEYLDHHLETILQQQETGYDHLDIFINGLLTYRDMPEETKDREPEMVFYQKTPARIIFELVNKAAFQPGDVFYDLGSGLGQVTMLVNLLSSVRSKGVEFEPAYCRYAQSSATDLNLSHVDFINADARYTDYSSGTVFFMYTPFEGQILKDVLQNIHGEAKKRKIRVFTYGSCSLAVARQQWLRQLNDMQDCLVELVEFESV